MRRILHLIAWYSLGAICLMAQEVTFSPSIALRDEPVYVTVKNAAPFKSAEIRLDSLAVVAARFNDNTATFRVPTDFPLGDFHISVTLGTKKPPIFKLSYLKWGLCC